MPGPTSRQANLEGAGGAHFFLYVEGPRDEDILKTWVQRISRPVARDLASRVVILGGRRPARAEEHFRSARGAVSDARGLVVLDRDHHTDWGEGATNEPGLEIFVWARRHIESYLMVPSAIRRALGGALDPRVLDQWIAERIPSPEDETACRAANAKRLLGSKGELARHLGAGVSPAAVARAMKLEEFHPDIFSLYERIREVSGLGGSAPSPLAPSRSLETSPSRGSTGELDRGR
ncbi:MAG: hypothetical protein P8Q97_16280 [Myxococcota bacterium]|jgi:hypothetical protein|nr:hypothetical protein [Myxococcota bacterium]